ncbi:Myelin-associated glycoprotein [Liparis tanakae]|uniref:Myelin-associated glycoprotein n=1 Tax=Liparis tanakae TaxID=230148 RepID=A0A4Z2HPI6_9TELE|nr:Myelin-associated glycoprotein [Liparis tanakae]
MAELDATAEEKDGSCQWNVWVPRDISAMTNSCVVIPCTFMYPSGIRPYRGTHGIWYFGQPYPQLFPPVVFKSRTDVVHESFKGRTKLLGDLHQRNCTLLINNIGTEHSGRYYFRADLDAPRSVWVNVSSEVMEGSSVMLHCEVDSNPSSRISWMFGDQELLWDTASNVSLSLDDVTPAQEGIYTCLGDNGYGLMNTSLYLSVKYPPREPVVNDSMTVQEGSSLALHCSTLGSPAPTLTWLKDGELVGTITADELSVLQLAEITPQAEGQYRCLAENEHGRASSSFNITVEYAPVLLEESKCTVVREGVQCVCIATGNPEPTIEFYLPDLNITINETDGRYNYYTHTDGHTSTGMIKLREKGERADNGGPAVNVHCSFFNMYGRESVHLELQQEKKYMMAVIVGTIGGVAVIAFIIAAVRYVGHNNKKENGNPRQDVVLENPALYYSAVKKDKQNLRKKVLKTELLGSKFNSILEETTGEDGDYQPVGSMAGLERKELNYAALEFIGARPREGASGRGDDGGNYSEIKAK